MTRKIVFSALICLCFAGLHAQVAMEPENNENRQPEVLKDQDIPNVYDVYLGLSTGINYGGLLGLTAEFNVYRNLALSGTIGLGTWGYKLLGDLRLYKGYPKGIYYVGGIGYATGISEIELDLETVSGATQTVKMELMSVLNVDLGIGYAWKLGKRVRFNMEIGYAVDATPGNAYELKGTYQPELSDLSKKTLEIMKPGGFRFGLGFNVGL